VNEELASRSALGAPNWRVLSRSSLQLFGAWLAMRLFTSLWAALVSALHPETAREQAIPLWPPASPLGTWLERVLLAPWERRDAILYMRIVAQGYRADDGTAQFHPLLAWLAAPIAYVSGQPMLGLMAVSVLASALLLPTFERLALLDLAPNDARMASLLLLCAPPAFVLFAPYTEGLFLLWSVVCLLCARRGAWWQSGLAGALAVLTRQQGIFLMLPLAWELWEAAHRDWRRAAFAWRDWLALGLLPFGLLIWLAYRAIALGDLQANFRDPQALIYSLIISPSSNKIVPVQAFLWPWQALWLALAKLARAPEYSLLIDLTLAAAFIVLLGCAWRGMRISYRIYALTITLASFAYYTGPFYPYMGLPRHLLLAFPVCIGLAPRFRRPWLRLLAVAGGVLGMLFLILQYVISGWVP
jgi:hypothetical protein